MCAGLVSSPETPAVTSQARRYDTDDEFTEGYNAHTHVYTDTLSVSNDALTHRRLCL